MLQGECGGGTKENLYFAAANSTKPSSANVADVLTISATLLGLVLNILSLVVFLRVFKKANSRSSFHLFLVFLSACEISFCLASGVTYANVLSYKKGRFIWRGVEGEGLNATQYVFQYSVHIPTQSAAVATVYYNLIVLFAYLAVVSQFARNTWVAITALLRCYVATRRTNVQVSQIYSIGRISGVFVGQLLTVVTLSLIRSYMNHTRNFFNFNVHSCNISDWSRGGTLLLHVTGDQERKRRVVNMAWTVLSQVIPLVAIITSSILLVNSLRANSSMVDSSERNKKITRMVFIFSLAFTLLEMPRAVVFFLANFLLKDRVSGAVILYMYQATYVLSLTDSTVNVFIYVFNDQHFKKELCDSECWRRLLRCRQQPKEAGRPTAAAAPEAEAALKRSSSEEKPLTEAGTQQIETTV